MSTGLSGDQAKTPHGECGYGSSPRSHSCMEKTPPSTTAKHRHCIRTHPRTLLLQGVQCETPQVNWGTAVMEELGYSSPGTVKSSQKPEHHDLPQPHCMGCHSQKPLLSASAQPGNTASPHLSPGGQKHPRTEKCYTWGRLLCSWRECSARAPCWYHCRSDKQHVPDPKPAAWAELPALRAGKQHTSGDSRCAAPQTHASQTRVHKGA